jgi:hypothetical protein
VVTTFACEQTLAEIDDYGKYLELIFQHLQAVADSAPQEVLDDALGVPADVATLGVTGVHHVAVYVGDWDKEQQVQQLFEALRTHQGVTDVLTGPSTIAPREYGTPAFWANFTVAGIAGELFTCRHSGPWVTLDPQHRARLMSHVGLAVANPSWVRPVLDLLACNDGVDLLAYAPADEIGHTYGHLINRSAGTLVEIVATCECPGEALGERP